MLDVNLISAELLTSQSNELEQFLQNTIAYMNITPEEFVEKYELEEYPPTIQLFHEFPDAEMRLRMTTTYRIRLKEEAPTDGGVV